MASIQINGAVFFNDGGRIDYAKAFEIDFTETEMGYGII